MVRADISNQWDVATPSVLRILWRVLFLWVGVLPQTALAHELEGYWALKIEGKNLMVMDIRHSGGKLEGRFVRPRGLNLMNGLFKISDPAEQQDILMDAKGNGAALALTFRSEDGRLSVFNAIEDESGDLCLAVADIPAEAGIGPWIFKRIDGFQHIFTGWRADRSYVLGDTGRQSREIEELYSLDQRALQHAARPGSSSEAELRSERIIKVKRLLVGGGIGIGSDYRKAAFILQHGSSEEDFLLAHTLAVVALAKGDAEAVWIAAATLDRYLQSVGKAQIYGTQRQSSDGSVIKPSDSTTVPEALRAQLGASSQVKRP